MEDIFFRAILRNGKLYCEAVLLTPESMLGDELLFDTPEECMKYYKEEN